MFKAGNDIVNVIELKKKNIDSLMGMDFIGYRHNFPQVLLQVAAVERVVSARAITLEDNCTRLT